jgi:hypothetical protein
VAQSGAINIYNGTIWENITAVADDGPVIAITSGTDTVQTGSPWTDAGATADGGEIVNATCIVDTNFAGTYRVVYSAIDASENVGTAIRTVTVSGPSIGESHQGGYIFYLDGNGGGLISATTDQAITEWGCYATAITGADGAAIGTGAQNTIDIVAGCATSGIAADICANLSLNGYTDWFLPSKDELNLMYLNIGQGNALGLGNVGGFGDNGYWSSTEVDFRNAWKRVFSNGFQYTNSKGSTNHVRAVRAF